MNIIGIDLGTSNCCISYINSQGDIKLIFDKNFNELTIPSIVSIEDEGILVGNEIDKLHINSNKNIFHNFKRLIGHNLQDIETTNLKKILNYDIIEENEQIKCIDTKGNKYNLEEIIFFLLKKIKSIIDQEMKNWSCIVTIPAYFNEIQRQITLNAINLAQLPCIKLLNEPTAASFAYLYHNNVLYEEEFDKKILIIDFGAGTLDLTILDINKSEELVCEVLGIYGDNNFGGIDITSIIYNYLFQNSYLDLDMNLKLRIAEEIKILLSDKIDITYTNNLLDDKIIYIYDIFCLQLKEIEHKIIDTIINILEIAKLKKEEIDDVILVGGSFKIPYFRTLISNYFNKNIEKISLKVDNQKFFLYEDIAVSLGAAVYGYYNNMSKDVVLIERLPLSIGIETIDNQIIKIIERNTIIPIVKTKIFTTEDYEQKTVTINIFQGESIFVDNCSKIGTFILQDLPPNKPVIIVSIKIDNNGIIHVSARDKRNITESSIKIESYSKSLTENEINLLIEKYNSNKENEKVYKNLINEYYELINIIDKISFQINFNFVLNLEKEIKDIIRLDFSKILNKINNKYIIDKYKININLLHKCAIINDLEFSINNSQEIIDEDLENFINMLKQIKDYLIENYNIFIIQQNDNIISSNDINKYEEIIEKEDIECSNISEKNELLELQTFLLENINEFNLTDEGNKFLIDKINMIVKENIESNNKINKINQLCDYVKDKYTK